MCVIFVVIPKSNKKVDIDIRKNFEEGKLLIVTVISVMGESAVIDFKESK